MLNKFEQQIIFSLRFQASVTCCVITNFFRSYHTNLLEGKSLRKLHFCTGQFQNRPSPPPPCKPQGHLTFLKNFGHIPRYVTSLDGQMPHSFELQRGSNRLFKCTYSVMNNWLLFGLTIDPPWLFYGITYEKKNSSIE